MVVDGTIAIVYNVQHTAIDPESAYVLVYKVSIENSHKVEQRFINIELELKNFKSLPVVDVIFLCRNGKKIHVILVCNLYTYGAIDLIIT